jgi:broad specificity phosphatase PhoE
MVPITLPHRLILIRHGETDWNREGRLQGGRTFRSTSFGRTQAAGSGRATEGPGAGFRRARLHRLADGACARDHGHPARELQLPAGAYRIDERLRELTFGDWEGFTWREIRKSEREQAQMRERDKWGFVPPGGESYRMLAERIRPALEELQRETVIVSHGGVARAVLALVGAVSPQKARSSISGRARSWSCRQSGRLALRALRV